ncbi:hypothetical protein K474DRAFT_1771608, partial [Panus rudis PR-1116 ss-1]
RCEPAPAVRASTALTHPTHRPIRYSHKRYFFLPVAYSLLPLSTVVSRSYSPRHRRPRPRRSTCSSATTLVCSPARARVGRVHPSPPVSPPTRLFPLRPCPPIPLSLLIVVQSSPAHLLFSRCPKNPQSPQ